MPKRVFIVDDSKTVICEIKAVLEKEGYEVLEAYDGKDAEEKLMAHEVDLLVTDLNMPHMNGIELATTVRQMQNKRFLPILMLTTNTNENDINTGKSIGVSAWLNKASDMRRLPKLVNMLIGS